MEKIDTQTLKQRLDNNEDFVLINALSEDAFSKEHIPGSENIPAGNPELVKKAEKIAGSKEKEIIVYCANPECEASTIAAGKLKDAGFANVIEYDGGMQAWKSAGHDVESSSSQTESEEPQHRGCCC